MDLSQLGQATAPATAPAPSATEVPATEVPSTEGANTPAVEPAEYANVEGLDVRVFKETITFKAIKDADKKEGLSYEPVLDKDDKPTGQSRRKAEAVRVAYPLLANFGITAAYNEEKNDYEDKIASYIYSLICNDVFNNVRANLNDAKAFSLSDISLTTLASRDRTPRGGRQAEVDVALLEKAIESIEAWLTAAGKKKEVVAHHVQLLKARLRGAATVKSEIISRMHTNVAAWFEALNEQQQEEFGPVFVFLDTKFNAALGNSLQDSDY